MSVVHPVHQIENHPTSPSGDAPTSRIEIADCGVLSPDDPSLSVAVTAADGDPYEDYPDDADQDVQNPEIALGIAKDVREIANKLFKQGQIESALNKYQSKLLFVNFNNTRGLNYFLFQSLSGTSTCIQ